MQVYICMSEPTYACMYVCVYICTYNYVSLYTCSSQLITKAGFDTDNELVLDWLF